MDSNSKSKELLEEFTQYCVEHPELRFWQALHAWAGASHILLKKAGIGTKAEDTFYWNKKDRF